MRMMQHEIKYNLISSIKDSVQQISTAMYSILEDCSHLDSEVSDVADLKPVKEIEPLATNAEEPVAKLQTRPVLTEEPVRVQTRQTFLEEISTKVQVRLMFASCIKDSHQLYDIKETREFKNIKNLIFVNFALNVIKEYIMCYGMYLSNFYWREKREFYLRLTLRLRNAPCAFISMNPQYFFL